MKHMKALKVSLIGIILILIVFAIIRIGYTSFVDYRDLVISQQQEQLLTITKSTSTNIKTYMKQKVNSLSLLSKNPSIIGDLKSHQSKLLLKDFYTEYRGEVERILLINDKGEIECQYPEENYLNKKLLNDDDVNYVLKNRVSRIGKAYRAYKNHYAINILHPIFDQNEFVGIIVSKIELNTLYNNLIFPIKGYEKGYVMVKNRDGIILMHPVESQIGIESLKVRKRIYPQFDWSELEHLSNRQKNEAEGTAVYHSLWWQEEELKWVKKLSAFTNIPIGDDSWSISIQMAFSEIDKPIKESLKKTLSIVLLTVLLLLGMTIKILQIKKNKDALVLETKYLKELNKAAEELQRSKARLLHAQKLETIGTLTGGIAHEFNNLLTPILGYSEIILQNTEDSGELHKDISEINTSAKRAKEIIEQILMFSRNDELISLVKQVNIASIVKESIKLMETVLPNNIKLIKEIDSNCGYIMANATQVQQVIINLCTNSYHATKKGGGNLKISLDSIDITDEISVKEDLRRGKYARICVSDTGCGMKQEILDQIFDPFFTTKDVGEGTGLGLSVVHGIINSHNGHITVDSEEGIGTTICIYLPLVEGQENLKTHNKDTRLTGEGSILIVDDDKSVLKVIKKGLTQFGYKIITKNDGYEAIELCNKKPSLFNAAVLDYTMPNINGLDLARKIREVNPDIKIILISGFIKESNLLSKYKDTIDDYMLKPISINELASKIKELEGGD